MPASPPRILVDPAGIGTIVERVAHRLDARHDDDTVVVVVLKSGVVFASDLLRLVGFHPRLDFVAVSPFEPGGRATLVKDISLDVRDVDVVLLDGVADTGLTLQYLIETLARHQPRSLTTCTLVDKPHRRLLPVEVDIVGVAVDDDFVVGYGLDFAGRYRNLPAIVAADLTELATDPDCYQAWAQRNRRPGSEPSASPG